MTSSLQAEAKDIVTAVNEIEALTSSLQAEAKDIVTAVNEIDTVTTTLKSVRDNKGTHHSQWFSTVEKMCADVGTEPSLRRRSGRQIHCSNVPADTPSEYYCHSISIPMLDHLLSEIKTRFTTHQKTALLGLCIVPSVMVTLPDEECASKVSQLADMYQDDLPSPDRGAANVQAQLNVVSRKKVVYERVGFLLVIMKFKKKKKTKSTIFIYRFPRVCNHLACGRLFPILINERLRMSSFRGTR